MKPVTRTERRRVFRVDPDAWRDPAADLDHDDVLHLGVQMASATSLAYLVPAALGRLFPQGRVRSWTVITVDDAGGLHRGSEHPADPGLFARAVAWLWTATVEPDSADDGAAYVESWSTESGAEAVACIPMIRDDVVRNLIAVWLTADDADALRSSVSRLTLIGSLCAKVLEQESSAHAPATGAHEGVHEALTVRQVVILQAMARGLTNAQIAREINFSESTVRLESMSIYRTFGVHSRTDAVRAAQDVGAL